MVAKSVRHCDLSVTDRVLTRRRMRPRPRRRKQKGPKFCAAPARQVSIWPNQAKRRSIAFNPSVFGRFDVAASPTWECRLGESPWLGAITRRDSVDQRKAGRPDLRQYKNFKSDISDLCKRQSACAAKARLGFATGACDKVEPVASTGDALSPAMGGSLGRRRRDDQTR